MTAGNPGVPRKLPMVTPAEDWMQYGNCKEMDTNVFFPNNGHNLLTRPAVEACNSCPVQMDCLDYALAHNLDHGIWGGTSERERRRIRKGRNALRDLGLDNNGLRLAQEPTGPPHSAHG